jgi:hypothetical protein
MDEAGIFLSIQELLVFFPRLKRLEAELTEKERFILHKIEKTLYQCLSVEEIEKTLGAEE